MTKRLENLYNEGIQWWINSIRIKQRYFENLPTGLNKQLVGGISVQTSRQGFAKTYPKIFQIPAGDDGNMAVGNVGETLQHSLGLGRDDGQLGGSEANMPVLGPAEIRFPYSFFLF